MNNENFEFNQVEVSEYHDRASNRAQAIALLNKLKARELTHRKIVWKDQQPTLVESTKWMMRTRGVDESNGRPATDTTDRVPSSWEAKRDAKNRRQFTLEETPVMQFKSSGHLPAHYYMDESALEAYIESLTKNNE
jgi:hypothetical protein